MDAEPADNELIGAGRVEAAVGSGGMGILCRAHHALDERVVALKRRRHDEAVRGIVASVAKVLAAAYRVVPKSRTDSSLSSCGCS